MPFNLWKAPLKGIGKLVECIVVCCSVPQCVAVCCSGLQCAVVHCCVLQCVAVCCSVMQCAVVCCSMLECAAVCCSTLQRAGNAIRGTVETWQCKHGTSWHRALLSVLRALLSVYRYIHSKEPYIHSKEPYEKRGMSWQCHVARQTYAQKSPVYTKKGPVYTQNSSVYSQKSPVYTQKSPTYTQYSAVSRGMSNLRLHHVTHEWVMPQEMAFYYTGMSHVTHMLLHVNASCHTQNVHVKHDNVTWHHVVWMSHVTHEWVKCHVKHVNDSHHTARGGDQTEKIWISRSKFSQKKSIWINESSVNPNSTSNQSSKPCTVLQYPSRKIWISNLEIYPFSR